MPKNKSAEDAANETVSTLQANHDRMSAIISNVIDAMIVIDDQGIVESFNPAAESTFGYSAEEVIGKNIKMIMPRRYADEHDGYLGSYRDTGVKKIIGRGREVEGRRKDGVEFPADLSISEIEIDGARKFVGILRDIRERKESEKVINTQLAIIANVVDGMIVINDQGVVESFNPAAEAMLGFDADEVIGSNIKLIMPQRYAEEHDAYLSAYRETGVKNVIGRGREVEARRRDGTEFPADLSISEINIDGERKFVGILRDISERKEAEKIIDAQRKSLLELSTPSIQLLDEIVLMPLVGTIDAERAGTLIEKLLLSVSECSATVAILDVTGVPVIDTNVARHLLKAVSAAKMLGAEVILTGIRPSGAQTLVQLEIDLSSVTTKGSLRAGVHEALLITGRKLVAE